MANRTPDSAKRIATGVELLDGLDEWQLVLRSLNRSPATIKTYSAAVTQFDGHQRARQCPTTVDEVKPAHIRSYLVTVLDSTSASTALTRWGGLLAFFKWATAERLCADDPMADVERPQRPELLPPVLSDDELRALFAVCGADFDGIRDAALMRFMLTTGCRRSEVAGIRLDELDLHAQTVRVMGKGRRERVVHIEDGTASPSASTSVPADFIRRRPRRTYSGLGSSARSAAPACSRCCNGGRRRLASTEPTRICSDTPSPTAGSPPVAPRVD